jgi:outer membrane protein assembly factor BamB
LEHTEPLTDAQRVGLGVNRGVTFGNGKVFRGYDDGNVVAIDAKSGKAAWSTLSLIIVSRDSDCKLQAMASVGLPSRRHEIKAGERVF